MLLYHYLEAEFKATQTWFFLAPASSPQETSMSSVFLKICSEVTSIGAPDTFCMVSDAALHVRKRSCWMGLQSDPITALIIWKATVFNGTQVLSGLQWTYELCNWAAGLHWQHKLQVLPFNIVFTFALVQNTPALWYQMPTTELKLLPPQISWLVLYSTQTGSHTLRPQNTKHFPLFQNSTVLL